MGKMSAEGRRFLEKWEEFVGYPYDDKVPKRRINGRLQYPEWQGGPLRGTLTVGFGHTDAAGGLRITRGMRLTLAEADALLDADLAPVEADVDRIVKVPLTQGQRDCLMSFTFNCGAGNLRTLVAGLNKGDYAGIPRRLMLYVTSKGERMQGLVNRRAGEVQLWGRSEPQAADDHVTGSRVDAPPLPAPDPRDEPDPDVFSPKVDTVAPPAPVVVKDKADVAKVVSGGIAGVGAAAEATNAIVGKDPGTTTLQQASDALQKAGDIAYQTGTVVDTTKTIAAIAPDGFWLTVLHTMTDPIVIACALLVGGGAAAMSVYWRYQKRKAQA